MSRESLLMLPFVLRVTCLEYRIGLELYSMHSTMHVPLPLM